MCEALFENEVTQDITSPCVGDNAVSPSPSGKAPEGHCERSMVIGVLVELELEEVDEDVRLALPLPPQADSVNVKV